MSPTNLLVYSLLVTWLASTSSLAGDPPLNPSRVKPPRITLVDAARADFGTQQFFSLTWEVANPNDASLSYTGYTLDSFDPPLKAGHIAPLYQIELKRDGKWQPDPRGFCGTGLADLDFAPRSSATFVVVVPADDWQMLKVGIGHHAGWSNEEASTNTIWSTEITRIAVDRFVFPTTPGRALAVGRWRIEFANGVVETCEVHGDGTATVVEPARTSGGKASVQDSCLEIRFDDDRIERWTTIGKRHIVEHWFPASQVATATPVLGIAERCE